MSKKRRIVGKIDKLSPALKDTVDQMLMSGESYREIEKRSPCQNSLKKADFMREQAVTDKKLDKVYDLILEIRGDKRGG